MKRQTQINLLLVFLLLFSFPLPSPALETQNVKYTNAIAANDFHLRSEPDGIWLAEVPANSKINIL